MSPRTRAAPGIPDRCPEMANVCHRASTGNGRPFPESASPDRSAGPARIQAFREPDMRHLSQQSTTAEAPAVVRAASLGSVRVEPLTCAIGAELSNVNLAVAASTPELMAEIRALLLRHRVLFFRDQDITRAEHVAFARHFGELEDHPVAGSDPDHPGLVRIYKSPEVPNDRYENAWHADATWRERPPFGCVLRCVECPEVGGDTMWSNMALAYERLPDHIKAQIAPLRARHSIEATFGAAMPIERRLALKA